jgi:ATP-binding cassette subfamily B protein
MIKRLAQCVRDFKRVTILTPIFVMVEVVMEILIPLLMANLIDDGIYGGEMSEILRIGGVLLVAVAIALLAGMAAGITSAKASAGLARNIRRDMFERVQTYSFSNIDKFSTASIVSRLTTDVSNLQNSFQMIIRVASRSPLTMIFALIMAFSINVKITLVFVAAIPILLGGLLLISKRVQPIFQRVFRTYDKLNNVVQENLRGVRVVKSFVRDEHEVEKFSGVSEEIFHDFTRAEGTLAFNQPLMQLAIYTCMLLASWLSAKIIVNSGATEMTTGQLTSIISYAMQILSSLMMLSMAYVMITMSAASARRVVEALDEVPDLRNGEHPVMEVKDGSITFENVGFSYSKDPNRMCLMDVDLKIPSGATVGIIGGTGSSKSTLVQLIPRLYDVTEGRLLVGGVDVRDYDIKTLRDQVAMVLQKNVLFSGTIKENLRWGDENATDEELVHACKLAQADGFIREFPEGYDTYIEQGGTNVSGGQKQRLCIARALLKKPKILILDDSTSAVDTMTDALIRKAFREEIPDTTKLIIAQRVASVQDADMILVMDNGRISAVGTHDELLQTSAIYREVYSSQSKGGLSDE